MKLQELLRNIKPSTIEGNANVEITGVNIDSRKIKDGHLFVAIKGTQVDGHQFIGKAIELGAKAILCEDMPQDKNDGICYIQVASTEDAVGKVATLFFGDPTKHLKLVGVTGTNGKTTIATLLYNMFRKFGYKVGLVSTVCNFIDDKAVPADHTTPDPIELNELLSEMVKAGCEYAFMECSSHAIHQKRIGGLKFAGGIFTNLTRDHLDYHKTFEKYRDATKAFFDGLPKTAFAITNADDRNGMVMVQNTKATIKTYSTRQMADFRARIIEMHFAGMYLDIDGHEVGVQFIGKFNVSNLLAVYAAARMLDKQPEDILVAMSTLQSVNGRLEPIQSPDGFNAIVDYAHTPDGLENILTTAREITTGKIIVVFGCGGDRDPMKRPIMGRIAAKYSDIAIVTSDNPRTEDPNSIVEQVVKGVKENAEKYNCKYKVLVDRRSAIKEAIEIARVNDIVIIAGKGHEDYQILKNKTIHFDDREEARRVLRG